MNSNGTSEIEFDPKDPLGSLGTQTDVVRQQAKKILEEKKSVDGRLSLSSKEATQRSLAATTAAATINKQGVSRQELETLLNSYKTQIQAALPKHLTPERLIRVALTAVSRQPKLLECDRASLLGSIVTASQLGLEPDGVLGQAYLVPFYNGKTKRMESQFQIGYKGLIDLARRSGNIVSILAQGVRTGDVFEYEFGLNEKLRHVPSLEGRGELTHFYAYAKLVNGGHAFEVMTLQDVKEIMIRSKSRDRDGNVVGPWQTDFEAMGRKTVIKRLAKYLPMSVELRKAVVLDDLPTIGKSQDLGLEKLKEDGSFDIPFAEQVSEDELEAKISENEAAATEAAQKLRNEAEQQRKQ